MEKQAVEAVLFSAEKPLPPKEIGRIIGIEEEKVNEIVKNLIEDYRSRDTALEILRLGNGFIMRVKPSFSKYIERLAERDLDRGTLRTLATIAYHQPIKMSDLARKRGNKAYEHVKKLEELGLVESEKYGRTKILRTTKTFCEYFGIEETDPEQIKNRLRELIR